MEKDRVIIFGLDGATFRVIDPLLKAGRLPVINELIENGTCCNLRSSMPPISPTAWSSFVTGTNPGKHGVLDFTYRLPSSWTRKAVNASNMAGPAIWDLLSDAGKLVGVINIPTTYPPSRVNGFMISGFPMPNKCDDYTYPRELASELKQKGWDLSDIATQAYSTSDFEPFLKGLYRRLNDRTSALTYLMNKYDWDFLLVHILETDKVQHEFWKYMENGHAGISDRLSEKYGNAIENLFVEVDRQLGQILTLVGADTTVAVVSDHGFCSSKYFVNLNTWLLQEKYIRLQKRMSVRLKMLLFKLGITPSSIFRRIPQSIQRETKKRIDSKYHEEDSGDDQDIGKNSSRLLTSILLTFDDIDWKLTQAYALGNSGIGQIYVNAEDSKWGNGAVAKAEIEPLKDEIISGLRKLTFQGQPLVDELYKREEIYSGQFASDSADIIFTFKDFNFTSIQSEIFSSKKLVERNYFARGESSHDMNGIMAVKGPSIRNAGRIGTAQIVDFVPTMLYLLDIAIPNTIDGKVLDELIVPQILENRKPRYTSVLSSPLTASEIRIFTPDEEKSMEESLKRMGYM